MFDPTGSYVEDLRSGEQIPMDRRGGIYEMRLWAKQFVAKDEKNKNTGFARQR